MQTSIPQHLRVNFRPSATPQAMVKGQNVRFTVLTNRLIRLEYSPSNQFEDRPSQAFWYREQPAIPFESHVTPDTISIETDALTLHYHVNTAGFTAESLSITLKQTQHQWRYGDPNPDNLGGTSRTLDDRRGRIPLEQGLLSRAGWTLVDDSDSLVFNANSWLEPRNAPHGTQDLYFFGYEQDYAGCLQDYCALTGPTPLVPRWSLGNWWSRYWEYDEAELTTLIEDFKANEIPLSVCIIDMDWHITETGNTSSGWTGYTWNRDLFPDPDRMLAYLHRQGLRTSMNLHPAEGIHPHEAQYNQLAERLGLDPETQQPIPFDIADPDFTDAYLKILHHPEEQRGVDFWWMDWQQGTLSKLPGLDPLWWLNHIHFMDLARSGRRPFIFSRWGGLGNHRYPIGFSGDTYIAWESLAFQPYFTATAANVRYGWWSHDIGGHHLGIEDPELYLRWIQYGVLSPIMRLHATKNEFHDRRPWIYDAETFKLARDAMQFRHALIPYLYSMAWRDHTEHIALARPMYHDYPDSEAAYHCPQQYLFGSDLIAAPFTTPADPETRLSHNAVWLPEGNWYNFFTGEYFRGDGWHALYGTPADIPLFARAGAIIPLGQRTGWGGVDNPATLEVHAFAGTGGAFTLYEDDGESTAYQHQTYALTRFEQVWETTNTLSLVIHPVEGDRGVAPELRTYSLVIHGISEPNKITAEIDGASISFETRYDPAHETLTIDGITLAPQNKLELRLHSDTDLLSHRDRTLETCRTMLGHFALNTTAQQQILNELSDIANEPKRLMRFGALLSDVQARALLQVMLKAGVHHTRGIDCTDRIVLWNNQGNAAARYQFAYTTANLIAADSGPLPRFKAIVPEQDIPRIGRHLDSSWRFRANFYDVATVDLHG